jgi:hypothetical protein
MLNVIAMQSKSLWYMGLDFLIAIPPAMQLAAPALGSGFFRRDMVAEKKASK